MTQAAPFRGRRMIGVAFTVDFIAVGFFFYSFSVFYPAMDADFEGASFWVAAGISVSTLGGGLLGPIIGRWLDRVSLRRIMLLGAVITSAGFVLLSQTREIWQYYLVLGTFFAFGLGMMGGMASGKLVANWFAANRGAALGIATVGVSLSGLVMPTIATWLVEEIGWRRGFLVYAVGIAVIVLPLVAFFVVTRPEDIGQRPDGAAPDAPQVENSADVWWTRGEILRARNFWVIALPFAMTFAVLSAVLIHLVAYASDLGIEGYRATHALSLAAGAGAIGKIAFGRLVDRVDPRIAVWASFTAQIAGLLLVLAADDYAALVTGGLVYGFGMGGILPLQGALVGRAFGRLSFGEVMGLMRPVQVPLNMVGVPLAAWIHDETGSFDGAFGAFLGVYVASAAIIALLRLPAGPGAAVVSDGESGLV